MRVSLLVAHSLNNVIGKDGGIPWHIPSDLGRFKKLTMGKPVIMGRKTYESLPEKVRPLPGRLNIVLTRNKDLVKNQAFSEFVLYEPSLTKALKHCEKAGWEEVFIIGGEKVYEKALPFCDKLYITLVMNIIEDGDAFFPKLDEKVWRQVSQDGTHTDSRGNDWEYLEFVRWGEKPPQDLLSRLFRKLFVGGGKNV